MVSVCVWMCVFFSASLRWVDPLLSSESTRILPFPQRRHTTHTRHESRAKECAHSFMTNEHEQVIHPHMRMSGMVPSSIELCGSAHPPAAAGSCLLAASICNHSQQADQTTTTQNNKEKTQKRLEDTPWEETKENCKSLCFWFENSKLCFERCNSRLAGHWDMKAKPYIVYCLCRLVLCLTLMRN